jgi:hypothetical protein
MCCLSVHGPKPSTYRALPARGWFSIASPRPGTVKVLAGRRRRSSTGQRLRRDEGKPLVKLRDRRAFVPCDGGLAACWIGTGAWHTIPRPQHARLTAPARIRFPSSPFPPSTMAKYRVTYVDSCGREAVVEASCREAAEQLVRRQMEDGQHHHGIDAWNDNWCTERSKRRPFVNRACFECVRRHDRLNALEPPCPRSSDRGLYSLLAPWLRRGIAVFAPARSCKISLSTIRAPRVEGASPPPASHWRAH